MSVKERLKEYIVFKKISIREFCRSINVAGTYVNNIRSSIQPDKLHQIAVHYSDLNTEWLLTGVGNMLKPSEHVSSSEADDHKRVFENDSKSDISELIALLKAKDEQIIKSQVHTSEDKEIIRKSQEKIDRLIAVIEKQFDIHYVPKQPPDRVLLQYNKIHLDTKNESMDELVLKH